MVPQGECLGIVDVAARHTRETQEVLWEKRLGTAAHGYPVTFAAGGKQYVAVPTGLGILRGVVATLSPEIYVPETGNALYVFALPD